MKSFKQYYQEQTPLDEATSKPKKKTALQAVREKQKRERIQMRLRQSREIERAKQIGLQK